MAPTHGLATLVADFLGHDSGVSLDDSESSSAAGGVHDGKLLSPLSFLELPHSQALSCAATGADVRFHGPFAKILCPQNCHQDPAALAIGSTVHPMQSSVCAAAIVDQVAPAGPGGEVWVTKVDGLPSYTSRDVGVAASLAATGDKGPAFHLYATDNVDLPEVLAKIKPLTCRETFASLGLQEPGTSIAVTCPGSCAGNGVLQGAGAYTGASSVCRAAQHAGIVGTDGGHVMVTAGHGQDQFFSSTQHGDTSREAHKAHQSFTVAMPAPEMLARTRVDNANYARFL